MKDQLLKGDTFQFTNENDMLELFFSEATGKFHCMFNAQMMHSSKGFASAQNFADKMIAKHNLTIK